MENNQFGFSSTTDEVLEGIDLTGKTVLVTGGSDGIGKETARALAAKGAEVTIVARTMKKLEKAASEIEQSTGVRIETGFLELDKPETIKTFAAEWSKGHSKLDILVNNAGINACPLTRTEEGWEFHFAINYLGHFLLTNLLFDQLKASGNARVVNVSSPAHRWSTVDFEDVHYNNKEFNIEAAYGQSKTAMIWFSNELDRRYKPNHIRSFSLEPGAIKTSLGRYMSKEYYENLVDRLESNNRLKTPEQGAATTCWAATNNVLNNKGGLYLGDCEIRTDVREADEIFKKGYAAHAFDEENEKKLWELSNELLSTDF